MPDGTQYSPDNQEGTQAPVDVVQGMSGWLANSSDEAGLANPLIVLVRPDGSFNTSHSVDLSDSTTQEEVGVLYKAAVAEYKDPLPPREDFSGAETAIEEAIGSAEPMDLSKAKLRRDDYVVAVRKIDDELGKRVYVGRVAEVEKSFVGGTNVRFYGFRDWGEIQDKLGIENRSPEAVEILRMMMMPNELEYRMYPPAEEHISHGFRGQGLGDEMYLGKDNDTKVYKVGEDVVRRVAEDLTQLNSGHAPSVRIPVERKGGHPLTPESGDFIDRASQLRTVAPNR